MAVGPMTSGAIVNVELRPAIGFLAGGVAAAMDYLAAHTPTPHLRSVD
jgi:hypothetical protein